MYYGRILGVVCVLFIILLPGTSQANPQIGFVDGLWFNTDTFIEAVPVRIYAAIRNHSGSDISGTVLFYVDDRVIKKQSVATLNNRVLEAWVDWTPTVGQHSIRAEFTDIVIEVIGESPQPISDTTELATTVTVAEPEPDIPTTTDHTDAGSTSSKQPSITSIPTAGLENYLAPSPVRNVLTYITDWSSSTKEILDQKRKQRSVDTLDSDTDAASAERISTQLSSPSSTPTANTAIASNTYVTTTTSMLRNLWGYMVELGYTISIAILSRPLLIQLVLLLGILFALYRTARFFGRRH